MPNMMAVQNPTPAYFTYSHNHTHHHHHGHGHGHSQPSSPSPSPFYSQPSSPAATPSSSTSSSSKPAHAGGLQHSSSLKCRPRPKLTGTKKPSCSTRDKRADVQLNLEMKVEKAKGFHAFFVPLGKSLPPAPPSSPVLGSTHPRGPEGTGTGMARKDYFEDWVEDVGRKVGQPGGQGSAMDLD